MRTLAEWVLCAFDDRIIFDDPFDDPSDRGRPVGVRHSLLDRQTVSRICTFLGLYSAPFRVVLAAGLISLVAATAFVSIDRVRALAGGPGTVIASLTADGTSTVAIASLCIVAVFKTALAEEIFFRGLVAKQLIGRFGFAIGNSAQAAIFGLVHLALVLVLRPDVPVIILLASFAAILGWFNGWLKERWAGGSIFPGIAAHATSNLVTYLSIPLVFGLPH